MCKQLIHVLIITLNISQTETLTNKPRVERPVRLPDSTLFDSCLYKGYLNIFLSTKPCWNQFQIVQENCNLRLSITHFDKLFCMLAFALLIGKHEIFLINSLHNELLLS